jgi:uncharacterized protein (UPF0297 family)
MYGSFNSILSPLPSTSYAVSTKGAFVKKGFCCWKNAITRFKSHERSEFHLAAITALSNLKKETVVHHLSTAKQKEMADAREALHKIFSTISCLAQQGLAFQGKTDESSNLLNLLELRAEDVAILNRWLNKKTYKWIHHDNVNEILHLMANKVIKKQLNKIKKVKFFAIIIDETSDISRSEQVSFSIRIVDDDLIVEEIFMSFFETNSTTAETLF